MNTFIKDNWFRLVASLGIILTCASVSYYFAVYLPREKTIKEHLVNQIKCQQDGTKLYESQIKKQEQGIYAMPEFRFNDKLNICLYKNTYVDQNSMVFFIIDVYTNKEVASWASVKTNNVREDIIGSQSEWKAKVNLLFDED